MDDCLLNNNHRTRCHHARLASSDYPSQGSSNDKPAFGECLRRYRCLTASESDIRTRSAISQTTRKAFLSAEGCELHLMFRLHQVSAGAGTKGNGNSANCRTSSRFVPPEMSHAPWPFSVFSKKKTHSCSRAREAGLGHLIAVITTRQSRQQPCFT